jgi:hypothetical protein
VMGEQCCLMNEAIPTPTSGSRHAALRTVKQTGAFTPVVGAGFRLMVSLQSQRA